MLFTITNKEAPATDLGYLLHKNPSRVQRFSLSFGDVHIFYPEARVDHCTAAMLLDLDAIRLVRSSQKGNVHRLSLQHYVNDRPYVASSFLSVAIAQVYGTALAGKCKERPELVERRLPLEAKLSVVPCQDGEEFIRACFEPLGYEVELELLPLDEPFTEWGESHYYSLRLRGQVRLKDLLSHIYVLIPVLDRNKHYWVNQDEQKKLLRHGEEWLKTHPKRNRIVARYLKKQRSLVAPTLKALSEDDGSVAKDDGRQEQQIEKPLRLHQQRIKKVTEVLLENNVNTVLDLGCGEGKLIRHLLRNTSIRQIVGIDLSLRALEVARKRVKLKGDRVAFLHSSLLYRDDRLTGFDAAVVMEVIEHIEPEKHELFEEALFRFAQPRIVVITTPNIEYNVKFEGLPAGKFRHHDHRVEWTRAEFQAWAQRVSDRYPYTVSFRTIGPEDERVGAPTQMAIFCKKRIAG